MVYINTTGKHNEVWLDKPYATITVECPDCPSTEDAYNSGWTDGSEDGYHKGYQSGYTDGLEACSGGSCEGIYESGFTAGEEAQKAKLSALTITSDWGNYTNENGWSSVTVNVPMKKWLDEEIMENGRYTYDPYPDYKGYKAAKITVNVPDRYNEGYNSGFTDGVNSVECSGYTQADLDAAFTSGYSAGLRDCSGYTPATSITLNVDSTITGTDQASVTVNPSDAGTDITYTSSDPSKATIDEDGVITVVGDGNVTFCAIDQITELQDCKTVNVTADSGTGVYLAGMYYVTSTTEPTQILTRNYGHDILLDKMEYPLGHSRETSNYFTFPATGMQTVYFYFKDPTTIPDKTFSGVTQLVGVNIPSVVNKIGDGAFRETSLTEVTIPSGVSLASYAFTRIPTLTAVTLGEGLSFSGGMECFSRTPITSITFPQSISAAPSHVLYNCSALTNVVFNGTLERLGDAAFGNCIALRNYVIPSSVTFIGESCFVGIPNIGSITLLRATPTPLDDNTTSLGYITETFPIYVPAGSVEAYKAEYLNYAPRIQAIP